MRAELGRFGPQAGMAELLERWRSVVGESIARNAWPARIARDGTVHVNTADSIWAFELGHQADAIAGRLGAPKLRFAPGPLPEPPGEPVQVAVEPTPADEARARELSAGIEDERLRETVQKTIALSLARAARDRPV